MAETMQMITLASRPDGQATRDNFRLETAPLPEPGAGEVLVEVQYLSLDPYMRGRMDDAKSYAAPVPLGGVMEGGAVGKVIASHDPSFQPGDIAMGAFGWASHGCQPAKALRKIDPAVAPMQTSLGVLGMPGFTGWHGFGTHGRPKPGETLVVGAATGAVGSMVGQLARLAGLRAIGVAGGGEKCAYAVEELGFDSCIDHRGKDARALRAELAAACPDGVDIYWENTGGPLLAAVLPLMNEFGRIPVCGTIAWYGGGSDGAMELPKVWRAILVRKLSVNGFIISDHWDRFGAFIGETAPLVTSGKIAYRESVTDGLSNAPGAFLEMLEGGNFGKTLVRLG